jgi:hypothetical protein
MRITWQRTVQYYTQMLFEVCYRWWSLVSVRVYMTTREGECAGWVLYVYCLGTEHE